MSATAKGRRLPVRLAEAKPTISASKTSGLPSTSKAATTSSSRPSVLLDCSLHTVSDGKRVLNNASIVATVVPAAEKSSDTKRRSYSKKKPTDKLRFVNYNPKEWPLFKMRGGRRVRVTPLSGSARSDSDKWLWPRWDWQHWRIHISDPPDFKMTETIVEVSVTDAAL